MKGFDMLDDLVAMPKLPPHHNLLSMRLKKTVPTSSPYVYNVIVIQSTCNA